MIGQRFGKFAKCRNGRKVGGIDIWQNGAKNWHLK